MNKFNFITEITEKSIATQIAILLNNNNKLQPHYTPLKIINSPINYLVEMGGFNERHIDKERKILGVIGLEPLSKEVTLIKHLSVLKQYRNKGIASSLLKNALYVSPTNVTQMHVRSDNWASLHFVEKFGYMYVYHEVRNNYCVLILGRDRSGQQNKLC